MKMVKIKTPAGAGGLKLDCSCGKCWFLLDLDFKIGFQLDVWIFYGFLKGYWSRFLM